MKREKAPNTIYYSSGRFPIINPHSRLWNFARLHAFVWVHALSVEWDTKKFLGAIPLLNAFHQSMSTGQVISFMKLQKSCCTG